MIVRVSSAGAPIDLISIKNPGNWEQACFDYIYVNCEEAREAISALLDGEAPGAEAAELAEHLGGCAACRHWRERAHLLTRSVRIQPAPLAARPPADLMEVLRSYGWALRRRGRGLTMTRLALVVVAAAQLALCVPILILGHDRSAPLHVAHEMGSLDGALGVGFLVAASRPARAMGMRSLVGMAAALLVLTAVIDLAGGYTSLLDEAPHLLVVAGWLLLRRLSMLAPPDYGRPSSLFATLESAKATLVRWWLRHRRAEQSSRSLERNAPVAAIQQDPECATEGAARVQRAADGHRG